jgi:glycosyltransferase involved in cell wall biosynthesis
MSDGGPVPRVVDAATFDALVDAAATGSRAVEAYLRLKRARANGGAGTVDADAAVADLRAALSAQVGMPFLHYPPPRSHGYRDLLNQRLALHGFTPSPLRDFADVERVGAGTVLHVHFVEPFFRKVRSRAEADAAARATIARLTGFRERGGHLVWSVHDVLTHDTEWVEQDLQVRRALVGLSHMIHVLHPATAAAVAPHYELPAEKLCLVELPLYAGAYPDHRTREDARALLGLTDELLIVVFGWLRPYKGIDLLVDAVLSLPEAGRPVRLLLAGEARGPLDEVVERARGDARVAVMSGYVPDAQVQTIYRAADLAVLPYHQYLNSAVMMLALTFGVPVLAARTPVAEDMVSSGLVRLFEQGSRESLAAELERARAGDLPSGPLAPAFAARHDPCTLAERFAVRVREIAGPALAAG